MKLQSRFAARAGDLLIYQMFTLTYAARRWDLATALLPGNEAELMTGWTLNDRREFKLEP